MSLTPARACGIDFGTSNSTVGWLRPGESTLLALEDGKPTLPSAIFFNADEESTHFGVGSSRVDLQACKLEYSIVSPK